MVWPIPVIPEQPVLPPPRYHLWVIILIVMLISSTLSVLFIGHITLWGQILLYGALPALLLWMCIFGVVLNRYEQSLASALAWHEETQQTKTQWQQWSRAQLAIVGNVLLTPEQNGMGALLGAQADIPMYPEKGRPLFGETRPLSARLSDIDGELERQCSGYRHYLHTVYILHASVLHRELIISSVLNQWGLLPESVDNLAQIPVLRQTSEFMGGVLFICLQLWPDNKSQQSSEFISAQLITSPSYADKQGLPIMAGLGRVMPLAAGNLSGDLDMLFDYNCLEKRQIQHVWLSGKTENNVVDVALYAAAHHWVLPKHHPVHLIDLSFGPPGEVSFGVSLAMMAEAVSKTSRDQLVISQTTQSSGWLCLVTRELFS